MNVVKTVRNNWKKSLLACAAGLWGLKYADQRWRDWNLMKLYCIEAKKYGDMILKSNNRPKKVAVILNPAANKGKGRSLYEKNVAPILNLAGLEVTLFVTQFEGQAKKLMVEVGGVDAIVVAGGDGTLSEVVTGIMKRDDESTFTNIPICIVPLGKTNTLAKSLYIPSVHNTVQFIAEMALSSVDGGLKYVDALNVKGGDDKSVYAVSNVSLGLFADSEIRKKRNWYFGPLKDRLCYIVTTVRYWADRKFTNIVFHCTSPCQGCNKCKEPPGKVEFKWWNLFIRPQHKVPDKDYSDVINESCGVINDINFDFSHLEVLVNHHANSLDVHLTPKNITKYDFIQNGWKRMKNQIENETDVKLNLASLKMEIPNNIADRKFIIDSEQYELMSPLSLQILPNKFKFYLSKSNRIEAPESKLFKLPQNWKF